MFVKRLYRKSVLCLMKLKEVHLLQTVVAQRMKLLIAKTNRKWEREIHFGGNFKKKSVR